MVANKSYKEDSKLYIDLTLKNRIDSTDNTQYYLGKLSQGPGGTKTVFARTDGNYLFTGWIDGNGYITLYNRTNNTVPTGSVFHVMCVVPI